MKKEKRKAYMTLYMTKFHIIYFPQGKKDKMIKLDQLCQASDNVCFKIENDPEYTG